MSVQDIISQINDAGGLARPNRYSVQIAPPKIYSSSALNVRQDVSVAADGQNVDPTDLALFQAQMTGQPPQNFGVRPDYFTWLGVNDGGSEDRLDFMCSHAELPGASFGTSSVRTYGSYFEIPHIDEYPEFNCMFIVGKDMWEKHFFDAWKYTVQDPETADFNYVDEYATTIDVFQLDEQDYATYGCRLYQAWPKSISTLRLDYSDRNSFHVLPVTFTYRKWINLRVNSATPTSIDPANGPPKTFEETIYQSNKK